MSEHLNEHSGFNKFKVLKAWRDSNEEWTQNDKRVLEHNQEEIESLYKRIDDLKNRNNFLRFKYKSLGDEFLSKIIGCISEDGLMIVDIDLNRYWMHENDALSVTLTCFTFNEKTLDWDVASRSIEAINNAVVNPKTGEKPLTDFEVKEFLKKFS